MIVPYTQTHKDLFVVSRRERAFSNNAKLIVASRDIWGLKIQYPPD